VRVVLTAGGDRLLAKRGVKRVHASDRVEIGVERGRRERLLEDHGR
jgi:hypothetical protein